MKKMFLLFICLLSCFFIVSCSETENEITPEEEFRLAMEEVNNATNITMDMDMAINVTAQETSQTINCKSITKANGNYSYSISSMNDDKASSNSSSEAFTYIKEDTVKVYSKYKDSWKLLYSLPLEDYEESNQDIWEFENASDLFTLIDGVWTGNTEKLEKELSGYIDNLMVEYVGTGITLTSYKVEKYEITLVDGAVDTIAVGMKMNMRYNGVIINYVFTINIKLYDLGTTTFDIPDAIK